MLIKQILPVDDCDVQLSSILSAAVALRVSALDESPVEEAVDQMELDRINYEYRMSQRRKAQAAP